MVWTCQVCFFLDLDQKLDAWHVGSFENQLTQPKFEIRFVKKKSCEIFYFIYFQNNIINRFPMSLRKWFFVTQNRDTARNSSFCAKRPLRPCAQSKLEFRPFVRTFGKMWIFSTVCRVHLMLLFSESFSINPVSEEVTLEKEHISHKSYYLNIISWRWNSQSLHHLNSPPPPHSIMTKKRGKKRVFKKASRPLLVPFLIGIPLSNNIVVAGG